MDQATAQQIAQATREQSAAVLAAAIITASGKAWSVEAVLNLTRDIQFAMYPRPGTGAYDEWAKTKDERLKQIHR